MTLCTLNIWGGTLSRQLLSFIKDYSDQVDIFCFQEVYRSSVNKIIGRNMRSNIYGEICAVLKNHQGYFAKHLVGRDLERIVDFPLESGLAIFIRNDIKVRECKDIFVYRDGYTVLHDDIATIPRNLQYVSFVAHNKTFLISHFHGIWYPKTKLDTKDRIKQSERIKKFLSRKNEAKILCGDFNLLPNTTSMTILEKGMRNLIKEYAVPSTRSKYYEREEKYADYILISRDVTVKKFNVIDVPVSDHLPLLLEFA